MDNPLSQLSILGASLALVLGLILLWRRRIPAYISALAAQSVVLAAVATGVATFGGEPELYAVAALILVVKGIAIPRLLRSMQRRFAPASELTPYVNTTTSLVIAGLLVTLAYVVTRPLVAVSQLPTRAGMPLAMGLVLVSLFVLISRRQALTQVVAFLMLENGIALLALLALSGCVAVGPPESSAPPGADWRSSRLRR